MENLSGSCYYVMLKYVVQTQLHISTGMFLTSPVRELVIFVSTFSTSGRYCLEYFPHTSTYFNISPMTSYPVAHLFVYKYLLNTYYLPGTVEVDERHAPFFQGARGLRRFVQLC